MSAKIHCHTHGEAFEAFVCKHLVGTENKSWFSVEPTKDDPWPDSWCEECHQDFLKEGEWNDISSEKLEAKLVCHHCYEIFRENCNVHYI